MLVDQHCLNILISLFILKNQNISDFIKGLEVKVCTNMFLHFTSSFKTHKSKVSAKERRSE